MRKVIVVGGGAAGLMAAVSAAQNGAEVMLLEKNNRLGKKLLITGKGRCNVTNTAPLQEFVKNIPIMVDFYIVYLANFLIGISEAFLKN